MPTLVPKTEDEESLKKIVVDYLQGESNLIIQDQLKLLSTGLNKSCTSLYKSISLHDKSDDKFVNAILSSLNINKNSHGHYNKQTRLLLEQSHDLHGLLTNLYRSGYFRIQRLLKYIHRTRPKRNNLPFFIGGAVGSAAIGGLFYFKPEYLHTLLEWGKQLLPKIVHWLYKSVYATRNIPLLGVAFHSFNLIWQLYTLLFRSSNTTPMNKFTRFVFKAVSSGLMIAANVLSYLDSGMIGPHAFVFFVLGSAFDVLESLYILSTLYTTEPKNTPKIDQNEWGYQAEQASAKNLNQRLMHAFQIKLLSAIFVTICVVIPLILNAAGTPSIVISLSCLVCSWFIVLAKNSKIATIHKEFDDLLQGDIKKIATKKDMELRPALTPDQRNLLEEQRILVQDKNRVLQQKKGLKREKEKLQIEKEILNRALAALSVREKHPVDILNELHNVNPLKSQSRVSHLHPLKAPIRRSKVVNSTLHRAKSQKRVINDNLERLQGNKSGLFAKKNSAPPLEQISDDSSTSSLSSVV